VLPLLLLGEEALEVGDETAGEREPAELGEVEVIIVLLLL